MITVTFYLKMLSVIVCGAIGLQSIRACLDILVPLTLSNRIGLSPSDLSSTLGKRWYGVFLAMACGVELARRRTSRVPELLIILAILTYFLGSYCNTASLFSFILGICGALVSVSAMCMNVLVQTAEPDRKSRNNTIYRVCGNITYSLFSLLLGHHVILKHDGDSGEYDTLRHVYLATTCVVLICAGNVYISSSNVRNSPPRSSKRQEKFSSLFRREYLDLTILCVVLAALATCAQTARSVIEPRFVGNLNASGSQYGSIHAASSFVSLLTTILVGRILTKGCLDNRFMLIFLAISMSIGMILVSVTSSLFLSSLGVILSRSAEESAKVPCNVWLANLAFKNSRHKGEVGTILSACIAFQKLFGAFLKAIAASAAAELIRYNGISSVFLVCALVSIFSSCLLVFVSPVFEHHHHALDRHAKQK